MLDIMLVIRATRLRKRGSCPHKTHSPMEDMTNKHLACHNLINTNKDKNRAFLGEPRNNFLNCILLEISVLFFLIINIQANIYKI